MNQKEIIELIQLFEDSSLQSLKYHQGECKLHLKKIKEEEAVSSMRTNTGASPVMEASVPHEDLHSVCSPMVGTFYRASSPDTDPFVQEGDSIRKGQILCIIEAMKMLNEIHADMDGTLKEILVNNGDMVDYGKPLFRIKPSDTNGLE